MIIAMITVFIMRCRRNHHHAIVIVIVIGCRALPVAYITDTIVPRALLNLSSRLVHIASSVSMQSTTPTTTSQPTNPYAS
eukprot:m.93091 g.93091  ORF g.93091 m.93091 type:complete len:80 (-) comp26603_c1_seq1:69-308(-)